MSSPPPPPPLVTRGFVVLGAAALAFFLAAGVVLPVAPQFARDALGADSIGIGVSIASFAIAALALRPVVGWSSDRFGRRPLLVGGALINVIALVLHLVVADLPTFIVVRGLLGVGEGFFLVAVLAAGADLAPPERRGEALSILSVSLYLGVAIGPLIGERALRSIGYDGVWVVAVLVASVAVVLAWLTPETAPAVVGRASRPRAPLIHPAGLFPGLIVLLGLWGMAGFLTFIPLYVPEVGLTDAGMPLALYALIVVGFRIVGARWPDRYGAARVSGAALMLTALGLAAIGLVPTTAGLIVGTALFGAGVAFTMPALLSLAVSRVPEGERGTVVGTTTVFLDIAFGAAPVGLGFVADAAGYGPTFVVSAVLAAIGSVLIVARRSTLVRPVAA